MTTSSKVAYLARMSADRLLGRNLCCPNCGCPRHDVVDRKYLVTELRRCSDCRLMFRAPSDSAEYNQSFYNNGYEQGFTTELPDDATLERWMATKFADTPKDYGQVVGFLQSLGVHPPARIFDFGCSWGYGSWQLAQAGYDVLASEISEPRARFAAQKLSVRTVAVAGSGDLDGSVDLFFSSHVLEHVPRVSEVLTLARRLLKPTGLFVAMTPNGSMARRATDPRWGSHWGNVHPNLLDEVFYERCFAGDAAFVFSRGSRRAFSDASMLPDYGTRCGDLRGDELVVVARLRTDAT